MNKIKYLLLFNLTLFAIGFAEEKGTAPLTKEPEKKELMEIEAEKKEEWRTKPGLYAVFDLEWPDIEVKPNKEGQYPIKLARIVCQLFEKEAPKTVANFVGLASGEKEWKDTKTGDMIKKPFYDGLLIHRVVPNFAVQGGDPNSRPGEGDQTKIGMGGPGYTFEDEFHPNLRHDKPGRLSMSNSGANTNGSQFFIALVPMSYNDKKHSVFGQVIAGQNALNEISIVAVDAQTKRPIYDIVIKKVKIEKIVEKKIKRR